MSFGSVESETMAAMERFIEQEEEAGGPTPSPNPPPAAKAAPASAKPEAEPDDTSAEVAEPEEDEPPKAAASPEDEPAEAAAEDDEESLERIDSIDDLARALEVDTDEFLGHIKVTGRDGDPITLGEALTEYRRAPGRNVESELAARQAEAKRQSEFDARMQEIGNHTAALIEMVKQDANVDWEALRRDDLAEYVRLREEVENRQKVAERSIALMEQERARRSQAEEAQREQWRQEQVKLVLDLKPEWKEKAVAEQAMHDVQNYMKEVGFPQDMVDRLEAALEIQTVWEAAQWRKLQSQKPVLAKKLRGLPKKAIRASARDETAPQVAVQKERAARLARLRETGREEDALSFFMEHIEDGR